MHFELFIAARYLRAKRRQVEAFARRLSRAPKSRTLKAKRSVGRRGGTPR